MGSKLKFRFKDPYLTKVLEDLHKSINRNSLDISEWQQFRFDMTRFDEGNALSLDSWVLAYHPDVGHKRVRLHLVDDIMGSPWSSDADNVWYDTPGGAVIIGSDTPQTLMDKEGLEIQTAANADQLHFAITNADVAQGMTAYASAETYFAIQKNQDAYGGCWMAGFTDGATNAMRIWGLAEEAPGGVASNSPACVEICAGERSGTGGSALDAGDNICSFYNWTTAMVHILHDGSIVMRDKSSSVLKLFIGDTINTKQGRGLTINQLAINSEAIACKSTSVGHGYTDDHENDTYYAIHRFHATNGGVSIRGMSEVTTGIELKGGGDTDDATKSTAGVAPIHLNATKAVGGAFSACAANSNLVVIQNSGTTTHIFDADGDIWCSGAITITGLLTADDLSLSTPSLVYNLSHDSFADFEANEHFTEASIDHGSIAGLGDDDHSQYILHSLADAANDFLVASADNTIVKKTLAETGAILEGDIEHDNLQSITANDHIDHSTVSITGAGILGGGGDISASRTITLAHGDVDHDQTLNFAANEHIDWTSTASSLVTTGDVTCNDLYIEDSGADHHLKLTLGENNTADRTLTIRVHDGDYSLELSGSTVINQQLTTVSDVVFNDVSIGVPSNIYNLSHDSFADFVANEHIDWTGAGDNFETSGTIKTTDGGSDYLKLEHTGSNAIFTLNDGSFYFKTDEGTNTSTSVFIQGKGTGAGVLRTYDQDDAEYLQMYAWSGYGILNIDGTTPSGIKLQTDGTNRLIIYNGGNIAFPGFSTEELRLVDSGSAAATEQDWIEVTVGGNTGYIRVFAAK